MATIIYHEDQYFLVTGENNDFYNCVSASGEFRLIKKLPNKLHYLSALQGTKTFKKLSEVERLISKNQKVPSFVTLQKNAPKQIHTKNVTKTKNANWIKKSKPYVYGPAKVKKKTKKNKKKSFFDADKYYGIGLTWKPGAIIPRGFR